MSAGDSPEEGLEHLTAEQRAWALHARELWVRAHAIASAHPGMDPGDVYHSLRCLDLTPGERLREALERGRLFASTR